MTATPMPETGDETVENDISLPFSLYFGALNHPHWSTYDHADPAARKKAEVARQVERDRRMRQLTRLHDHLHHLKVALGAVNAFDRNGQGPSAAVNLRTAKQRFNTECDQLTAGMIEDAELWRENGRAAMEQLDDAASQDDADDDAKDRGDQVGRPGLAFDGRGDLVIPKPPSPAEMERHVRGHRDVTPAQIAAATRRNKR